MDHIRLVLVHLENSPPVRNGTPDNKRQTEFGRLVPEAPVSMQVIPESNH
jgi:hypothetical protein